ncbi:MAG: hypothetical protein AAGC55_21750 [Myxococcota bacterium]
MNISAVCSVALTIVLGVTCPARADSAGEKQMSTLAALIDLPLAKAKKRAGCKSWTSEGSGQFGTEYSCNEQRLSVRLSVGLSVHLSVDDKGRVFLASKPIRSSADHQQVAREKKALVSNLSKRCKEHRKRPQLLIFECTRGLAVIVLENWNSTVDKTELSMAVGRADTLFRLLGLGKSDGRSQ